MSSSWPSADSARTTAASVRLNSAVAQAGAGTAFVPASAAVPPSGAGPASRVGVPASRVVVPPSGACWRSSAAIARLPAGASRSSTALPRASGAGSCRGETLAVRSDSVIGRRRPLVIPAPRPTLSTAVRPCNHLPGRGAPGIIAVSDMRTTEEHERLRRLSAEPRRSAPVAEPALRELASDMGNRAFVTLMRATVPGLQRDTPAAAPEAAPAQAADPAAGAKALLAETPKSDVDHAAWLLKAADQGFASLWPNTKTELEAFRDGKKTAEGVEPSATEVKSRALLTMYDVVKGPMSRWSATPTDPKKPVALGSFLRGATGLHGGSAIDLPRAMGAGSTTDVITMLGDLSAASYGIGLPFSGEYFDPADDIAAKQAAAVAAAGKDGTPATVTGAVRMDNSHIYKSEWDADKKAWKEPAIEKAGQAYTKLGSQPLKDKLQAMRTAGATLTIFPDRPGHVHVDQR